MRTEQRVWLWPLVLLSLGLAACARPEVRQEADQVRLSQADVDRLNGKAAEVDGLKVRIAELEAQLKLLDGRLSVNEQRNGLRPLQSAALTTAEGDLEALQPGDATYVGAFREAGKKRNLGRYVKDFDGYVMVFWATWCVPCTSDEELALLAQLQPQLARRNVALVSVAIDDLAKVQVHPKAERWIYPLWFAKDAHLAWLPQSFIQRVGVGLPIFLVVSRTGKVRYFANKKLDATAVRDIVTAAIN